MIKVVPIITLLLIGCAVVAVGSGGGSPPYRVSSGPVRGNCLFNRVLPNRTGSAALWADGAHDPTGVIGWTGPGSFVIMRLPEAQRDAQLRIIASDRKLTPIRWSRDLNTLYIRGADYVSSYKPAGGTPAESEALRWTWHNVRINAIVHGGLEFLKDPDLNEELATLRRPGDIIRTLLTAGPTYEFLGVSGQSGLPLIGLDKGRRRQMGVSAVFLIDPTVSKDRSGRTVLRHVGDAPTLSSAEGARMPYVRPLIDFATGSIVGRFGQREVHFEPGRAFTAPAIARLVGAGHIVDAAVDGDLVSLLIEDPDQSIRLVHGSSSLTSTLVCERQNFIVERNGTLKAVPADPRRSEAVANLDVRTWRLDGNGSAPSTPIGQIYSKKGAHPDRLVVYFHGGPSHSLWNDGIPQVVEELSAEDRAIVTVEYSGSTGAGLPLAEALPRLGPRAIERDARLVADWARAQGYRDVQIVAESFGAVPALAAIQADPQLFKRIFFIAPLIRLRDPKEWTGPGRRVPNSAHQLASEYALYGGADGREKMRTWLEASWTAYSRDRDDRFYFGGRDDVSKPSDMPGEARPDLKVTVFGATNHQFISGRPEIWADIRSVLGQPARSPTPLQVRPSRSPR